MGFVNELFATNDFKVRKPQPSPPLAQELNKLRELTNTTMKFANT